MPYHLAKYFSEKQELSIIDKLMMAASIIHPLTAIPQVYIIYANKDASGVSLFTWFFFMLIGLIFLAYGLAHKLKPFIINQFIWFTIDLLVVIGVFIYG